MQQGPGASPLSPSWCSTASSAPLDLTDGHYVASFQMVPQGAATSMILTDEVRGHYVAYFQTVQHGFIGTPFT